MEIYLLGTNHKTADIEFREKIAFSPENIPKALQKLRSIGNITEAEIISTCNRTEIYAGCDEMSDIYSVLSEFLSKSSGMDLTDKQHFFYRMKGEQAVQHLFKVAAGLDSMVVGEPQILGQLKDAYRIATEELSTGVLLNRLMSQSFAVGKRVRRETNLGEGAVSVAYAAVELAQKIFKDLEKRSALLIGAGDTGELTARHLKEKSIGKLFITNRTRQKAEHLAEMLNGEMIDFERMLDVLPKVDIIIGTATAPQFLIDASDIRKHRSHSGSRTLFMIDIGVPRNFDPKINQFESVFLHDIDDLEQIVDHNISKRKQEIPRAESIVSEETEKFLEWKRSLQITPTLVELRKKLENIRLLELNRHCSKLSDTEFQKIDRVTRALVNKVLHLPMVELKKYANGHPEGLLRVDIIREIFGLGEKEDL
ncbi:MAG: glutamyl-tRNA reductase [Calditrichaeota bacterium]|nr:glutamyl-tRNA reductase [Calditrichota bacterium]RQW08641.1 MAG: glutamyl-tRNA reductase [Calditrichota bacterium]